MTMSRLRTRSSLGILVAAGVMVLAIPAVAAMMAPPSISIVSPAMGATFTGSDIPVTVAVENFNVECANLGKTNAPMGEGHIHVMVDGLNMAHLTTVACSTHFTISGQGLKSGKHVLAVVLANDAHAMNSLPAMTSFTYEPRKPNPLPEPLEGKPSVKVVSPKNGATVSKKFDLIVALQNFNLSCDLEGKPNVAGWGHIHVMVQQNAETSASPTTPMVAMMKTPAGMAMEQQFMTQTHMSVAQMQPMLTMAEPSMIGMPCTATIPVDLSTWHGGMASIVVQLANDDHMPTMGAIPATLSVNVR
jgi:hypothetical protein